MAEVYPLGDMQEMNKLKRNNWSWVVRDNKLLDSWFDNYQTLMRSNCVKANDVRSVFTAGNYFVKYDKPQKLTQKLRSFFSPKVKYEFDTAIELEDALIPVVNYVGWGKCGSLGMVVTEAFPNAVDLSCYWFAEIVEGHADKATFISQLTPFLKSFFETDFYHPDFHLGNILFDPVSSKLALVDVYGIKKISNMSSAQKYDKYKILFSLRDGLSDKEIIDLMKQAGVSSSEDQAVKLWENMQRAEAGKIRKYWPKRRRQILSDHEKYVTVTESGLKLRHSQSRSAIVSESEISKLKKQTYSSQQAELIWLNSFQLQFYAVPHIRPVAMKTDSHETIIYFENKEIGVSTVDKVEELVKRCTIAGIKIDGDKNSIGLCEGKSLLSINALESDMLCIT